MNVESPFQPVRFHALMTEIKKSYPHPGEYVQEILPQKVTEILDTVSRIESDRMLF